MSAECQKRTLLVHGSFDYCDSGSDFITLNSWKTNHEQNGMPNILFYNK